MIKVESSRLNDARSIHDRRGGDDPSSLVADGKTSSTSSRTHHTRHPMEARCGSKSREKIAEGDEDDQWTRLIRR